MNTDTTFNPWSQQPAPEPIQNPWEQPAPEPAEMTQEERDRLLGEWMQAKQALEAAKLREMELRLQVNPIFDSEYSDDKPTGTRNIDLGNGWKAKCRRDISYKVDAEAMPEILEQLEPAVRETIVKKKYELSKTQYKALQERAKKEGGFAASQLRLLQTAITSRNATPSVEIVPPKAK